MISKCKTRHIVMVVLLLIYLVAFSARSSWADNDSKYLDAVREFADNVLEHGRDKYGPKHTPLFVDGLYIGDPNHKKGEGFEPVKWIAPNGDIWILSNFASQQNWFRLLDGLTTITGDPKYRQAAMEAIEYAFANLRSPNGLIYWGRSLAFDAQADKICGGETKIHCLKFHYPYYELMWQVDSKATKTFIESFWSTHILNWSNLDMNRVGSMRHRPDDTWKHEYKGGPVFFESRAGEGRSFMDAGSDLFYGAAILSRLSGDKESLIWAKRLAHRYVETRDSNVGIAGYVYTRGRAPVQYPFGDDFKGHLVLFGTLFPVQPGIGNPAVRQWLLGELIVSPGIVGDVLIIPWICQFLLGETLGAEGKEFTQWALEELTAWGKVAYRQKDNSFIPMLTDGMSLEGYVCKKDSEFGPRGTVFTPIPAVSMDFWAYALAYRVTGDGFMWEMARNIGKGNKFGDIGKTPQDQPQLRMGIDCSDPYVLMGFLEVYRRAGRKAFLRIAERIGNNILTDHFYKGFFVPSHKHTYAKFDNIEPLVLLHLDAVLNAKPLLVPQVWPNRPSFISPYRRKESVVDNRVIYNLTESSEPPRSLQEAAAYGEIDEIKSLISKGADVNGREDTFLKTALHRGVINGHKDIAELLLANGADVDAADADAVSVLHYAAEKGHRDIVELLLAKGANVNAKNKVGETALGVAVEQHNREIVELLVAKGAEVSIHAAAFIGDINKVKGFLERGGSVDTADASGQTFLHYVTAGNCKDIAELLISNGANVNAVAGTWITSLHVAARTGSTDVAEYLIAHGANVNAGEWTPLQEAAYYSKEMVELLLAKGADINTGKWTALHSALDAGRFDIVELLLAKGADANIRDGKGRTPLHIAAWYAAGKNNEIVELLLSKGADVNAKDNNGKTALSYAIEHGHTEIFELLLKHGAK